MCIERAFSYCYTPEELVNNIPKLTTYARRALEPSCWDGADNFSEHADAQMYEASWNELLNLRAGWAGDNKASTTGASASTATSRP